MLTENITSLVEKPEQVKRYTVTNGAPGLAYVSQVAVTQGLDLGQVFDFLLRNFLPMAEYNEDVMAQAAKRRATVQINPMVLMWFLNAKSADSLGQDFSNKQFLTYLLQDMPDNLVVELLMKACTISERYRCYEYTTISCPKKLFSLITRATKLNNTHKGATMSAFIDLLLRWLDRVESQQMSIKFEEPHSVDPATFREMLDYAFGLGMTHED